MSSPADATTQIYPAGRTALLFVDPYNDFLAEGGKLWPRVAEIAKAMHAAHDLNGPTFAHAILASKELIARLPHIS